MQKTNDTNKNKLTLSFFIVLLCLLLLVTSSYAWMSMASVLTVSNLELSVCTQNALQIAPDIKGEPGEWGTILDLAEWSKHFGDLRPITYDATKDNFFHVKYGLDGRTAGIDEDDPLTDGNGALVAKYSAVDEKNNEPQKEKAYLYAVDFWLRSQSDACDVFLTTPLEREAGILGGGTFVVGEPVWNEATSKHNEEGNGTECAVRLALRVYEDGVTIDEDTKERQHTGEKAFIMYEPNADGGKGLKETLGISGGKLEGSNKLIQQKKSTWTDKSPALKNELNYTLGEFITEDTSVLHLERNTPRHLILYFWLEGQDQDCVNELFASGGKLLANLQFYGETPHSHTAHSIRLTDEEIENQK